MPSLVLKSPLCTDWTEQYVRLTLPGAKPGDAWQLALGGEFHPFQYTGEASAAGAGILVKLALAQGEQKELVFSPVPSASTDLARAPITLDGPVAIGLPGRHLQVGPLAPFAGFAAFPMHSAIRCDVPPEGASLARTNEGPLFTDYELVYRYAQGRSYVLNFRCYKLDPWIEVTETFSLGLNASLAWTLNPAKCFTHIISRDNFESERQPSVEPLGAEHPRDVLCRLQMPVLGEYFIPNNRAWFGLCHETRKSQDMIGILGLYGARWEEPVANMPEIFDRGGTVEWQASLASGRRHFLLCTGAVEKEYTPERRLVFHRLHAEFNALRLDDHLDLSGDDVFDRACAREAGALGRGDFHAAARERFRQYPCLGASLDEPTDWMQTNGALHLANARYLVEPTPAHAAAIHDLLVARFEKWVRQFQGFRTGVGEYNKNVIGFTRYLRAMLIGYEMLRRDGALEEEQAARLGAWFAFAARRITDEGRWPHSRTWRHPDHPESTRDFYTYGGEHKPDRLVWTNCLPNFQSDPMCALAHLSAIFKDHPDAAGWLRFSLDDIERQLDAYCGRSGAWEESINYALYTFSYLVITFKAVKERWGLDYFQDERVRRYAGWLCRFLGPLDKRFGLFTMPGVGNAVLPQTGGEFLLSYAGELAPDDPLRAECIAVWQRGEAGARLTEHYPVVMAVMAPAPEPPIPLRPLSSECMDEVGVALRDRHTAPDESYLFQKIGFAKDHYEEDETAFNWYAKGTPFCMDYGTYTGGVGVAGAHNVVEIPDADALRRGYLADHLFTPALDYTRCEVPVVLKLLWGKVRSFAEVENKDGKIDPAQTPFFYIGDKNPVGPKVWKVRQLLFVKPDYTVLFDRVYGRVPHRYNLHFTGADFRREGPAITADGRFDLDLLAYVQHPREFALETGELVPKVHAERTGNDAARKHAQHYFRLYNETDGLYRTLLFAKERGREVAVSAMGDHGVKIVTSEYTDYVFLHDEFIRVETGEAAFQGRAGWIRRERGGRVQACVPDGDLIAAFGHTFAGRGPWSYGVLESEAVQVHRGAPRTVRVARQDTAG